MSVAADCLLLTKKRCRFMLHDRLYMARERPPLSARPCFQFIGDGVSMNADDTFELTATEAVELLDVLRNREPRLRELAAEEMQAKREAARRVAQLGVAVEG